MFGIRSRLTAGAGIAPRRRPLRCDSDWYRRRLRAPIVVPRGWRRMAFAGSCPRHGHRNGRPTDGPPFKAPAPTRTASRADRVDVSVRPIQAARSTPDGVFPWQGSRSRASLPRDLRGPRSGCYRPCTASRPRRAISRRNGESVSTDSSSSRWADTWAPCWRTAEILVGGQLISGSVRPGARPPCRPGRGSVRIFV